MKTITPQNAGLTAEFHKRISKFSTFVKIAMLVLFAGIALTPVKLLAQAPNITYASPQVFIAGTAITPVSPTNSGGAVAAAGAYGNPQTIATPGANQGISGVTVDSYGNVYFGLVGTDALSIQKLTPGSTKPAIVTLVPGNENDIMTLGIDPKNNLYIGLSGPTAGTLETLPAGSQSLQVINSHLNSADAVTGNAFGFIFLADQDAHSIQEFTKGSTTPVTFSSVLTNPVGVAVDASGNVFAVDGNLDYVTEFKVDGTTAHLGSGLSDPTAVVADAAGNIFVADAAHHEIKEFPVGGSAFITIGPGTTDNALVLPTNIAVDASDNLYITEGAFPLELKYMQRFTAGYTISPALPAGLSFNSATGQISGTPTQAMATATYTITAVNVNGASSATLSITVNPAAPSFKYNTPNIFSTGSAIKPLSPTNNNGVGAFGYNSAAGSAKNIGPGFTFPRDVAVDAAGNVYVTDADKGTVVEVPSDGGSKVILGSGFNTPTGVAVDASGNIYVADATDNVVKKIPAGGGSPVIIGSGFSQPAELAVDAAGNVYVADYGNGAVKKIPVGGAPVIIGSGISGPEGVAVDAAGNVYVAEFDNDDVKEILASNGNTITIASGLDGATEVASDAAGNLYVTEFGSNRVVVYIAAGKTPVVVGPGFKAPVGIATNGNGNVYVTDFDTRQVLQIAPTGGFFANSALPKGLSINSTTGVISGTPTATQGAANYVISGYNITGGSSAAISIAVAVGPAVSYQTPASFILGSAITALTPASLNIAAQAYADTTVDLAAPGVTFVHAPSCLSIDKSSSLYVSQGNETYVTKIYKDNSAAPINVNIGFENPSAMYVDAKSFLYLCNPTANSIVRVDPFGGAPVTLYSGLNNPSGIVLDASGNIYEADYGSNTINRFPAAGGTPVAYGSGFSHPEGLAFDAAGNLYVSDYGNNAIKEVLASDGSTITLLTGLSGPTGVAVDATGNVFVVDRGHKLIKELPAGSTTPVTIGQSFNSPFALVVDPAGIVYFTALLHFDVYQIQPSGGYYLNTALPAGLKFSNATGVISGTPTIISPAATYTVTAWGNGYSAQAAVNISVVKPLSTDALLTSIKLTPASTLTVVTGPSYVNYTTTVAATTNSITVTAAEQDPTATLKINGVTTTPGTASASIPLIAGTNVINIVSTAQDGVTTKTYTITATRPAPLSTDALLTSIKLSPASTLSVVTGPSYVNYTTTVAASTSSVMVTAAEQDPTATLKINGVTTTPGITSAAIPLTVGNNTINIVSTAQDGVTTKTYTITATRPASLSTDALLTSIKLSPASTLTVVTGPSYVNYTTTVAATTSSFTVTATEQNATATLKVDGITTTPGTASAPITLAAGTNIINIVSTAQDGVTTKTYTITATKPASANLNALKLSTGVLSPAFASATTSYTAMEVNATASVTVTASAADATATIKVNGTAVTSGAASAAIPLTVGLNTITTVVAHGTATQTYTIKVTRAASTDALLTSIKLTPASTLTIVNGPSYVNYTTSVPNTTGSVTVTATEQDLTATLKINGVPAISGSASTAIPLVVGSNTINIVSTAQDGVTTKTYTITATRAMGEVNNVYEPISITKSADSPDIENGGIIVHQAVSPNGDGVNDYFMIDGIANYPDNRLMIVDRNGTMIYQTRGYDNSSKLFDGHSNINGKMQLPGTYFYSLDYTVNGQNKHTTGFLILKY